MQAPVGKDVGLHEKISAARDTNGKPLSESLQRRMRCLTTIRNRLVHERGFDSIPDRSAFVESFRQTEEELKALLPKEGGSGCVMS